MTENARAAILAEIDKYAYVPNRQPGDITISELKERYGVTEGTVKARMQKALDEGAFEFIEVHDPVTGRRCKVYRKAQQASDA